MKKKSAKPPEPSNHARLAPSAFKGYEICPSYKPSSEATKASERGTELHGHLEQHEEDAHEHTTNEDDAYQLQLIGEYIAPFLAKAKKKNILKEHKFNLKPLGIDGCDKGTGDLLILDELACEIDLFDYKLGFWEVDDAETNIQLWIYNLGCFDEFKWCETLRVHILQPARNEVSTAKFTREDFNRMLLRARTIADRVNKHAGKVFNVVVDNCLWCNNKANCLSLHNFALQIAGQASMSLPETANLDPEHFEDREQGGDIYDLADLIAKWSKAIKYKITQWAVDGDDIPGHDLREVEGKRIVVDPEGAYELLRDKYKVSLSEFFASCSPSISGLLKAVSVHGEHGNKAKLAVAASNDLMGEGVITKTNPSAYLVRIKKPKEQD